MAHITTLTRAYNDLHNSQANTYSYSGSFETFKESEVRVTLNANNVITTLTYNSSPSDNTQYSVNLTDKTIHVGGANLTSGVLSIFPVTDLGAPTLKAPYSAGSAITASDITNNQLQVMRRQMEFDANKLDNTGGTMTGDLTMGEDVKIIFEGATDNAHETTLTVADPTSDKTITFPDTTGTVVTTGDTGTVATAMIANDAINSDKIADDQINSEHYVDGSIDTAHYAAGSVNHTALGSSSVITAKINDLAVTTGKIADDAVTADKLAHTSVTPGSYTAVDLTVDQQGRITSAASGTIAGSEIAADAIDGTKIADDSINSEHYVDGSIDHAHLSNDCIDGDNIQDDVINSEHYAADSIDTEHYAPNSVDTTALAADAVTGAQLADNAVDSEHYVDGSIDTVHIAGAQVTDAKLASNSVTTSKITDANVTTVKVADANITLAKLASDLKQTTISDSDTQLPTSGAVVDYVAAQLLPFGGFEAIATEVAFPNTQPASGVAISISDAGGVVFNGSGTSTTGRTVGGSTVTINNAPSSLNGETLVAGVGLIVTSTGLNQEYNYHKILGKEDDIKQLSDDINDFNARYRVGSSNPTSALDGGDLFFNTGSGKLLVYNNTQSAWEEAQSIGQYFINTISSYSGTGGNSASFNGAAYRFVLSNPGTVAEQHIVSINGVVQKPNSGTSQPSEGFAIDGSSIIFSSAPASSADFFIITIGSSVNIGTPSNGTVSTDKLANGAVTTDKIADDAVTAAKLASNAVVNASVDASAAIAGTKISPNFGSQNVATTGHVDIADDSKLKLGDSDEFTIFHAANGSSYIKETGGGNLSLDATNILLRDASGNNKIVTSSTGAAVTGNLDVSSGLDVTGNITVTGTVDGVDIAALNTTVGNITTDVVSDTTPQLGGNLDTNDKNIILGDSDGGSGNDNRVIFGAGTDLQIYHDGSHSRIVDSGTGNLILQTSKLNINNADGTRAFIHTGASNQVELYYDNSKKIETTSTGVYVYGNLGWGIGGTGNLFGGDNSKLLLGSGNDLQLYHDGTNNFVYGTTNCATRFATNDTIRCSITNDGHFVPYANNTYDLGTSSYRWRNVYTNDLHLSNKGHTNDVDGSWGDWTIQEGESDLFLKNNRSGKKYKFNLTEVS